MVLVKSLLRQGKDHEHCTWMAFNGGVIEMVWMVVTFVA
jgi:hypothetical protein